MLNSAGPEVCGHTCAHAEGKVQQVIAGFKPTTSVNNEQINAPASGIQSIRPHTYGHMNSYDIDVTVSKQPEDEIKGSSLKEPVCWQFSKHKFQNKS